MTQSSLDRGDLPSIALQCALHKSDTADETAVSPYSRRSPHWIHEHLFMLVSGAAAMRNISGTEQPHVSQPRYDTFVADELMWFVCTGRNKGTAGLRQGVASCFG